MTRLKHLPMTLASATACLALVVAPQAANAAHGKAGLWQITVTMGGGNPAMPDMSKLPPEVQARMQAMGMGMHGNTVTTQTCRTPAEVAQDVPPSGSHDRNCTMSNVSYTGHDMNADMTCTGNFTGTGHVHFVWDSNEHFTGDVSMTGSAHGHDISRSQTIEGRWLSADCAAAQH
jgi:hypothetical protein